MGGKMRYVSKRSGGRAINHLSDVTEGVVAKRHEQHADLGSRYMDGARHIGLREHGSGSQRYMLPRETKRLAS